MRRSFGPESELKTRKIRAIHEAVIGFGEDSLVRAVWTRPKIETVPSSIPKTTSPAEADNDCLNRPKSDIPPMATFAIGRLDPGLTIEPIAPQRLTRLSLKLG